ncbi:NAD(P)-binding domain-containing protein [Kribbella sp. NPDC050124]|uniref:NAD(P)-binding domain-containing protein n=1 Tax=Kribbella sp. NPDC050124 TaxID=3364114 RepID=UPI00379EAF59
MTAIGFIGLRIMGSHLSANLVRAGHAVTGYRQLWIGWRKPSADIAGAVNGAEVVITMLPDSPAQLVAAARAKATVPSTTPPY